MATYSVSSKQLTDNYAVLTTLEPTPFEIGQNITVASVASPFSGTFKILDLPEYLFIGVNSTTGFLEFNPLVPIENQVLYACTGADVLRVQSFVGTITYTQTCSWVTAAQVETYLGIPVASADDQTFLVQCASAANNFIYRRRQESGYHDSLTVVPSGDVDLGVIQYASALYRVRGSVDSFSSFNEMGSQPPVALSAMVMQLCGIGRPQVA
jgi:hypothetical protein